jgi:hypothetical protein
MYSLYGTTRPAPCIILAEDDTRNAKGCNRHIPETNHQRRGREQEAGHVAQKEEFEAGMGTCFLCVIMFVHSYVLERVSGGEGEWGWGFI